MGNIRFLVTNWKQTDHVRDLFKPRPTVVNVLGGVSEGYEPVSQALVDTFLNTADGKTRKRLLSEWFNGLPLVGGQGGGTQIATPPGWQNSVAPGSTLEGTTMTKDEIHKEVGFARELTNKLLAARPQDEDLSGAKIALDKIAQMVSSRWPLTQEDRKQINIGLYAVRVLEGGPYGELPRYLMIIDDHLKRS